MLRQALVVIISLMILGCNSSQVLVGTQRPRIKISDVKVYLTPPPVYEEIAMIEADTKLALASTNQQKMNVLIKRMKEKCAEVGANGLLMGTTGGNHLYNTGSGVAIFVPKN